MPVKKRIKTQYPGVYYVESTAINSDRQEKIYYIMYRRKSKLIEEKAGRQFADNMTPAKAADIRKRRIEGAKTNRQKQQETAALNSSEAKRWTINRLWKAYEGQRGKSVSFKTDLSRYTKYIEKPLGTRELKDINPSDVDRLRDDLSKRKSPQTVKHVLGMITRLHNFSMKNNLAPGLSFAIAMPVVNNRKTEDLTQKQITALLQAIEKSEHVIAGAIMKTALYTGMKRGEMFRLEWDDIDFDGCCIFLRDPTGGASRRIPLNDAARKVFQELPRTAKYVFPGRGGKQRTTVSREVNEIKKAAGLPEDFRPLQGLRHTYASILAGSGKVDIYTLQKLLAHKSPQMTQRYAHLRDDSLQQAADLAGDIISQVIKRENIQKKPRQLKIETRNIDQYDIAKKVVKKTRKKKANKKEKTAITSMKQLKMF